jgi:hypothetical protein
MVGITSITQIENVLDSYKGRYGVRFKLSEYYEDAFKTPGGFVGPTVQSALVEISFNNKKVNYRMYVNDINIKSLSKLEQEFANNYKLKPSLLMSIFNEK